MNIDFDNNIPIYIQLVNIFKIYIISGKYMQGEKIPSVRELAQEMKVNPNTIQKALTELENLKLLYTERTNGKYVTTDKILINKLKNEQAETLTKDYIKEMKKIDISLEEIKKLLEEEFNETIIN